MFGQVDDAGTCNIAVGGVGDVVQKQLIYVASIFFARPGVKTDLWPNAFGFRRFGLVFFCKISKPVLYGAYDKFTYVNMSGNLVVNFVTHIACFDLLGLSYWLLAL